MAEPQKTPEDWSEEFHAAQSVPSPPPVPDPVPVMSEMTAAADAELAKEASQTPPELPPPEFPQIEPPPQTDVLAEMGKVAKADAGIPGPFKTAWQKRHPDPVGDVMREMSDIAKELGPDATGRDVSDAWEKRNAPAVAKGDTAGRENERVQEQRMTSLLDNFNRLFATQNRLLKTAAEMLAAHERHLSDIQGLLERSRS